jgi:hypothetical protein
LPRLIERAHLGAEALTSWIGLPEVAPSRRCASVMFCDSNLLFVSYQPEPWNLSVPLLTRLMPTPPVAA